MEAIMALNQWMVAVANGFEVEYLDVMIVRTGQMMRGTRRDRVSGANRHQGYLVGVTATMAFPDLALDFTPFDAMILILVWTKYLRIPPSSFDYQYFYMSSVK